MTLYGGTTLDPKIRSRLVENGNGLTMHVLEAGHETPGRPVLLLLHGFPELAYSWRKVMVPLAAAGFHVLAPDQRGYGRTSGGDDRYDGDLSQFDQLNVARDAYGLVAALGLRKVRAVIGHDFGAAIAAWCAILRPDVFASVAIMSAPFAGPPTVPFATDGRALTEAERLPAVSRINPALGRLEPPRKHYHAYYATPDANPNMQHAAQGIGAFLRAYYHQKSADWAGNTIHPLTSWTAEELAKLPGYYVMPRDLGMAETVAGAMPSPKEIAACKWLTEAELAVYAGEFARNNGFQGGLNWYRTRFEPRTIAAQQMYSGRTIDVPACFIAGASDWGVHQVPGALEAMSQQVCREWRGTHLVPGAGHWVQQEQPEAVVRLLLAFVGGVTG